MNHDKLKGLLKETTDELQRLSDCPDDYQLASYMDGGLSEADHSSFENHTADCDYCIERIGILGRARESEETINVSKQNVGQSGIRSTWQAAPRWAVAALVVLAVGFLVIRQSPDLIPPAEIDFTNAEIATERFVQQVSPFPEILSPLEDSLVDPHNFVFKWRSVPDSLFYDIRIVSDDGALISRERVWATQWQLPADMGLQAGAEYFVRVDAYVSEGKAVSSEHTLFKVVSP